jgi:hypothetical protein
MIDFSLGGAHKIKISFEKEIIEAISESKLVSLTSI